MYLILHLLICVAAIMRVLLRPHRDPASRLAWIVVILAVPALGVLAYVLLGERNIGRKRIEKVNRVMAEIPGLGEIPGWNSGLTQVQIDPRHESLFRVGTSVSGYPATDGNRAELMADSNASIARMVTDIDAATDHVHLLFYIWMPDNNGTSMARALIRAVTRGVTCRAMVDDMGSHLLINSGPLSAWTRLGLPRAARRRSRVATTCSPFND